MAGQSDATLIGADCGSYPAHYVARLDGPPFARLLRPAQPLIPGPFGSVACENPAIEIQRGRQPVRATEEGRTPRESAELPRLARRARRRLLAMHYESRIGHLGGNLSALDALIACIMD